MTRIAGLAAVVSAAALLLAVPSSARAGTFVLEPCSNESRAYNWNGGLTVTRWTMEASCPSLAMLRSAPFAPGQLLGSYWSYPATGIPTTQLIAARFGLAGSDGSEVSMTQSIRACRTGTTTCGSAFKPSGTNVNAPERHELAFSDGEIPTGANAVRVEGKCNNTLAVGCQAARPLEVHDLQLEYVDDGYPTLEHVESDEPVNGAKPLTFEGWNSGRRYLTMRGRDQESGVLYGRVWVGDVRWDIESFGCGDANSQSIPFRCPTSSEFTHEFSLDGNLWFWGWNEGYNPVMVELYDAAGNPAEVFTALFKVDVTRPYVGIPKVVGALPGGWQTGRELDVEFDIDDWSETETQSPVTGIKVDLDRIDGGLPNPPAEVITPGQPGRLNGIELPANGLWRLRFWVIDAAGNSSEQREVIVGADDAVPAAPTIEPVADVGAPELRAGRSFSWNEPTNASEVLSGVCGYASTIDSSPLTDPGDNYKIYNGGLSEALPRVLDHGTNYIHLRAVSCTGVRGEVVHHAFEVDAEGPSIAVSSPGTSGWYSESDPLTVAASSEDGGAVEIRVVSPEGASDWHSGGSLTPQLSDGVHALILEARDSLGNVASFALSARIDRAGPLVRAKPRDPGDPTRVVAELIDADSGLLGAEAEVRVPGGVWRSIGGRIEPNGIQKEAEFSAVIPDLELVTGRYELRLTVRDAVGHATETSSDLFGNPLAFSIPLRSATSLTVGFAAAKVVQSCRRVRKKRTCRSKTVRSKEESVSTSLVDHGRSDTVFGQLRGADGSPLANRSVEIIEDVLGQGRRVVDSVSTDVDGRFRHTPEAGPSRRVIFRHGGNATELGSTDDVELAVKARVTFSISRRVVARGRSVVLKGRVSGNGAGFPPRGVPVELECIVDGEPEPCLSNGQTDRDGVFRLKHTFPKRSKPLIFKLRLRSKFVAGWPFEPAVSPTRKLVVK